MAVFYEGFRVPWTIPGLDPKTSINLDPATFHPEMLPEGRIIQGNNEKPLYLIPTLPGRISIRSDGYVEFILSRHYEKENQQSRNKKVIIGKDASSILPGMMFPNDTYFKFFDLRGKLRQDPEGKEKQQTEQQEEQTQEEMKEETEPKAQQTTQQTQTEESPTDKEKEETLIQRERAILEKELELRKRELQLCRREQELQAWQEELENAEDDQLIKAQKAEEDHIKLLSYILDHYLDIIKPQASRKPATPLSRKQIQTINELLSELKSFFAGSEMDSYLHLAEEPDPDQDNPGTTNGEMALLLGVYQYTLNAFRYGELRKVQNHETRET